ncbi:hypothetical protein [Streptomyces sp. NPDC046939]|uniref:hypothetical protein n=1 Tax=Streptomyces sp. NPDC046939 TaxID=3155376 RepID=UPI0033DA0C7C
MIIGAEWVRWRRPRRAARWLLAGLLLAGSCWSAGPSAADGAGTRGLTLTVTVNTRPGVGALRPGIRVGHPVVVSYHLVNRGSADLHDVRLSDPLLPGARIHCPGATGRVPLLVGLHSARCTATGTARPGNHTGDVRAVGRANLRALVQASARAGYAGVGAGLSLTETARVTGDRRAEIRYVVANTGNRTVLGVRLTDPVLAPDRIVCPGGPPVVARLAAGARAACTAVVRRAPGTYESRGRADGSDRIRTLGPRGGLVPAPLLTARAAARFTIRATAPTAPAVPAAPAKPRPPRPPKPAPAPPASPGKGPLSGATAPHQAGSLTGSPLAPQVPPGNAAAGTAGRGFTAPGLAPGLPATQRGTVPGAVPPGPVAPDAAGHDAAALPPSADRPANPPAERPAATPAKPPAGKTPAGKSPAGKSPAGRSPAEKPTAEQPPAVPPTAQQPNQPPSDVPSTTPSQRSLLGRFMREDHTPTDLGVLTALFLILLPAAIAAAVFGSRRL